MCESVQLVAYITSQGHKSSFLTTPKKAVHLSGLDECIMHKWIKQAYSVC